jgi:hypothetical protein
MYKDVEWTAENDLDASIQAGLEQDSMLQLTHMFGSVPILRTMVLLVLHMSELFATIVIRDL